MISFRFDQPFQSTKHASGEHLLKARVGVSRGFSSAMTQSQEKEQSSIHLATGVASSQTAVIGHKSPLIVRTFHRRYKGKFENGLPEGHGVMVWASGDEWEGEFQQGRVHGQGVFRSRSGSLPFEYHGGFANGNFEGYGSCRCSVLFT